METQQIRLDVIGVRVELPANQPVLILRGAEPGYESMHVAVVVGPAEAAAVARALQQQEPPRPMTHDLLAQALETLGGGVASIEIGLLDSSTYCGTIRLNGGAELDSRASDAIAVAVRARCPVTMDRATLRAVSVTPRYQSSALKDPDGEAPGPSPEASQVKATGPISEEEIEEFQKYLDRADPEDFGRS
ncbi:bifunctional nuclease family protein [Nesterenkonia flava]|uniref:Bifunctional nuclease family protein n=1 Tax=Nesterenkonia flava TaxID=469799 RepID=A0ABU1FXZ1_9MICC|nr:bifunctional nuclease family protein [Nesterenkonia flava]MDR5713028.1 bifunctional nuclease family protein [Nesterenkonia flava]